MPHTHEQPGIVSLDAKRSERFLAVDALERKPPFRVVAGPFDPRRALKFSEQAAQRPEHSTRFVMSSLPRREPGLFKRTGRALDREVAVVIHAATRALVGKPLELFASGKWAKGIAWSLGEGALLGVAYVSWPATTLAATAVVGFLYPLARMTLKAEGMEYHLATYRSPTRQAFRQGRTVFTKEPIKIRKR